MASINIVFPHQLHEDLSSFTQSDTYYLVEEHLFFRAFNFHKQKIAFHRASMQYYKDYLTETGARVNYISSIEKESDIRILIKNLGKEGIEEISCYEVTDDWLSRRLKKSCARHNIKLNLFPSPLFINSEVELQSFFKPEKKKFFQTSFYKQQRKARNILIDPDQKPLGGKWTYDTENRKKYPKGKQPPIVNFPESTRYHKEALEYTLKHFPDNLGTLDNNSYYPISHAESKKWWKQFLEFRFFDFGIYEDAIVTEKSILNHSVLTPMLNVGMLEPLKLIEESIAFAEKSNIPINSLEGFVRQILGWREFIRGIYLVKGRQERTTNFWEFKRKIPASFYDGTTGILPIDITIKKVLKTGYCHHIERLMILGNFMVLCEFDPDEVYRWFMELFIDAYDWVMVPNVYGMSQYADGGLLSTKPYISSSNYILKMSDYKKGPWAEIWDGLFWRFMQVHRDFFSTNPRLGMLLRTLDKMPDDKRDGHMLSANKFLKALDKN
jgi:deoxyribodipyrimidine photolyase-related protein